MNTLTSKVMRTLLIVLLVMATTGLQAADDPLVSKVTSNSLAQARVMMETFCAQASTNVALRPFASPAFWSGGVQQRTNGFGVMICDCNTISPCYEISATSISPQTIRIDVRSMDASPDAGRPEFRPKRNVRVMEELVRLLERKP